MRRSILFGVTVAAVAPAFLAAQTATLANTPVAGDFASRYDEIMALAPRTDRVADVRGLTLVRDAGTFKLDEGKVYLLTDIGGRTVGAGFKGRGTFTLIAPNAIEEGRIDRFFKAKQLSLNLRSVIFLFADSTASELTRQLKFVAGDSDGELRDKTREALNYLTEEDKYDLPVDLTDLLRVFLNNETSSLFWAHITREGGEPVAFTVNPYLTEGTVAYTRARRARGYRYLETVTQFPTAGYTPVPGALPGERQRDAEISSYTIDLTMPETMTGEVSFKASASIEIASAAPVGPWVAFRLYHKLKVDSAQWGDGSPAQLYRDDDDAKFWVRLPGVLEPGRTKSLRLWYHGDLADRISDFFFIESSTSWYPRPLEGRSLATFDLTYHLPKQFTLASVGERVDSSLAGRMVTTRWKTAAPIRNASFNIGLFKTLVPKPDPASPPVVLLWSEDGHRLLQQAMLRDTEKGAGTAPEKNVKDRVAEDMVGSLKFFRSVYGEPPAKSFYATEIPYGHGEAFPGLVHLSYVTFLQTSKEGEDEIFRAHEVAHQWWGIGVDLVSYRDRWLSEGLAEFSGLWYMQTRRSDNEKYFARLRTWRTEIMQRSAKAGPISLGHRVATAADGDDYSTIVYLKGAWVAHMLRGLMIDLKTMNEDKFKAMMRDFYTSYRGKRASTDDFRRVVEAHTGTDMNWFFDQWVHGTAVPTYRVATVTEPADGGKVKVTLHVAQDNVPESFQMYVPVMLDFGDKRIARLRVLVKGRQSKIELPLLPEAPKRIVFNDLEGVLADVKMVSAL